MPPGCLTALNAFSPPSYFFWDNFVAQFRLTSAQSSHTVCYNLVLVPSLAILFVLFLPLAVVVAILWVPMLWLRRRCCCSVQLQRFGLRAKPKYTVVSTNVCLFPESVSRKHNLANVVQRAKLIGTKIMSAQVRLRSFLFLVYLSGFFSASVSAAPQPVLALLSRFTLTTNMLSIMSS